jgi:polyribonucleotide nucleotidyltransferase
MKLIETEFGGRPFSIETGKMAKQAGGSVVVRYGDTVVLVTATAEKEAGKARDFFPLSVHYVEKAYATGRIPGGFFKREGRLSDRKSLCNRTNSRWILQKRRSFVR